MEQQKLSRINDWSIDDLQKEKKNWTPHSTSYSLILSRLNWSIFPLRIFIQNFYLDTLNDWLIFWGKKQVTFLISLEIQVSQSYQQNMSWLSRDSGHFLTGDPTLQVCFKNSSEPSHKQVTLHFFELVPETKLTTKEFLIENDYICWFQVVGYINPYFNVNL